jgi:hypothetical protein
MLKPTAGCSASGRRSSDLEKKKFSTKNLIQTDIIVGVFCVTPQ